MFGMTDSLSWHEREVDMNIFDSWKGTIEVNGKSTDSVDLSSMKGAVSIHLFPMGYQPKEEEKSSVTTISDGQEYVFNVRAWMTKESTPEFDFMDKFNKGIPMPLRVMVGTVEKETPKMLYVHLHGDILQEVTQRCMCCGKPITNNVSKYFGLGPVCGGHNYVNPFETTEELKMAVAEYKKKLQDMTWEGWLPKSAIESQEKI